MRARISLSAGIFSSARRNDSKSRAVARTDAQPPDGPFQIAHLGQFAPEIDPATPSFSSQSCTASRRRTMGAAAASGWLSQSRKRRAPIGVTVRLSAP